MLQIGDRVKVIADLEINDTEVSNFIGQEGVVIKTFYDNDYEKDQVLVKLDDKNIEDADNHFAFGFNELQKL
jgi:hypothetical protein